MAKFDREWPGWQWRTRPEELTDRIAAPLGGLALVEIDGEPRQLLSDLRDAYANHDSPHHRFTRYFVYQEDLKGNHIPRYGEELTDLLPEFAPRLHELTQSLTETMVPLRLALGETPATQTLILAIAKRIEQRGHSDGSILRAWAGSTKPGFFVVDNDKPTPIDSLPEGNVLLMRGGFAKQGGIRHGAIYRGREPRLTLLADR